MDREARLAAQAEESRKFFIESCIKSDTPRLAAETYPDGLDVQSDIPYIDDGSTSHLLDIYTPGNAKTDEVFLLIHGGAFVYGAKELDKCFGMHLALRAGIPVVNINYRLMPDTDLQGQLQDIFSAIAYACSKGVRVFHTIGDSAGGYLCLFTAILLNNKEAREECGLSAFEVDDAVCRSTSPICGAPFAKPDQFAGYFFDREGKMPSYIYNLADAVMKFGCPPIVLTTGDQDMMRRPNLLFYKKVRKTDIPVEYYCAESTEDRVMHHVYAIAHPTWPEGIRTIEMTIANMKK